MTENEHFAFVEGPIPYASLTAWMERISKDHGIGAHAFFAGQVRADAKNGKHVQYIAYSAYVEMAFSVASTICEEIIKSFEIRHLSVLHSLGQVNSGDLSLLVMVAGKHRSEVMEACREVVERIKKDLPVWGKEWLEGEDSCWKVNT